MNRSPVSREDMVSASSRRASSCQLKIESGADASAAEGSTAGKPVAQEPVVETSTAEGAGAEGSAAAMPVAQGATAGEPVVSDVAEEEPAAPEEPAVTGERAVAEELHARSGVNPSEAVLLAVSPGQRVVDVVTGATASRRMPDRACALAVLSMTTSFAGGDLVGGIVNGLRQMSDQAGHPRSRLH